MKVLQKRMAAVLLSAMCLSACGKGDAAVPQMVSQSQEGHVPDISAEEEPASSAEDTGCRVYAKMNGTGEELEIGELQYFHKDICSESEPETVLLELDFELLQLNEQYSGAERINGYLSQHQENNIAYAMDELGTLEEMLQGGSMVNVSSYSSEVPEITFMDRCFISFCQKEYDYHSGAAHGIPAWIGFTFDINSGERLVLSEVVSNSEEELKEIVTTHFEELFNQNPEEYWGDAVECVAQWVDYDADFYLTGEGICFYFEPYALAPYAAGFQEVIVPYRELSMNISIYYE